MNATRVSPTPEEPVLLRTDADGIATLTLNRPAARNALSLALLQALESEIAALAADESVRVVVIAGNGPAFCAGHDLREMHAHPDVAFQAELFRRCGAVMLGLLRLPQPVIARVHAIATAAGCQLVATCDLAVAAETAKFATPGVDIGLFCTTPGVALGRAVARKPAMEMLLTGAPIDARAAEAIGLVNRVVPEHRLDAEVAALARQVAGKSRHVVALGKQAFYRQLELGVSDAYAYAAEVMTRNMLAEDAAEGIDSFLQKRKPVWRER